VAAFHIDFLNEIENNYMRDKLPAFLKKVALFLALSVLAVAPSLRAQQPYTTYTLLNNYTFSMGTGNSTSWLSPQPTYSYNNLRYDWASPIFDIGFDFMFEGRVYSQFKYFNGSMCLGSPQLSYGNGYYNTPFGTTYSGYNLPKIVAVGAPLVATNFTYGVVGTAPNRVGVFTFTGYFYQSSANTVEFQIQLYENTGEIRLLYGSSYNTTVRSYQTGIATTSVDLATVNPRTHTVSYVQTNTTYTAWPGQYTYYSFMPPYIPCAYLYNLSVRKRDVSSVSLTWKMFGGWASDVSYVIEYGPTGFTRGSGTKISARTQPVTIGGLQQETDYTFYVRAVCDTFDTSAYSYGVRYTITSGSLNTCIDFSALNSQGVTCTYGAYQNYGNYSRTYPGPYATVGSVDYGQDRYGSQQLPGSRHTVHTLGEMDSCSGYQLSKIPPGENKSVRLGCVYGQNLSQAVSYDIVVDTNESDIVLLRYACVFYNPSGSHTADRQPRFVLEILDASNNPISATCGSADFNSSNAATPGSGWNHGLTSDIFWKDWTPVGLHLAAYHGQTIKVRLATFACGQGAAEHFGYAYYTLTCAKAKISSSSCVMGTRTTLAAPAGFNYRWYCSTDTLHPVSTNRTISIILDSNYYYYCDVSFIDNANCKFRVYHDYHLLRDTLYGSIAPEICAGYSFVQNGDTLTRAGVYSQSLLTVGGCDSVLNINLIVRDTLRDTIHRTICAGQVIDTNGHLGCAPVSGHDYPPYYRTGVFTQYLRDTTFGCFQNLVIDLTVNDTLRDTLRRTIRAGERVDTNGHLGLTPVSGSNYPPYYNQGVYTQYLRDTATGCFHNLIIDIIVNDTIRDTIRDTICAGAVLDTNGHQGCVPVSGIDYPPYYLQGVYTQYLRDTVTGYFRNLVIDLTVNDTLRDTLRRNICEGDFVDTNGHLGCVTVSGVDYPPYYNQGVYTQYLRDTLTGCFHNLVIDITVSDTVRDTVYRTICAGASFDTNGVSYTHAGFYSQLVNDNVAPCYVHRLYIDLTVNDTLRDTIRTTLCAGAVLDTNGHKGCVSVSGVDYPPYYLPGVYRQYLRDTVLGCFQNLVIEIAVNDTLRDTLRRHLCAGEVLDTNGHRGCVPVSGVNYPPYYLPGVYHQYLRHPVTGCFQNLVIDITVADTIRDTVFRYICAGASFDTNGQSFSRTGFYTQLLRNPQTQCYNRLYIKVTVYDTVRDTIRPVICAGSSIDTNGQSFTQTGFYNILLRDSVTQCLSRLYIDLTVNDTFRNVIWHTICAGATFTQAGQTYYRQGTYIQRFQTIHGCDSITEINLNVNDTIRDTIRRTICAGASFDTNGQSYTRAGFYSQLLRNNASGCYNRLYIRLTVRDTIRDTVYRILCAGTTFDTNGQTFSRTGFYSQLLRDPVTHCYNRLYIDIIVNDTLRDTVEHVVCAGKTVAVNGHPYYRDGWYRQKMRTPGGCDSVLHIHIIVPDTLRDTIYYDICAGQTVNLNGQTYTTTGWYRQKLQTRDGCDSILNIHLSVSDTISDSLYLTICVGKSIELNGQTFTKKGWYRQDLQTIKGCDSILHVHIDLDTPRNLKAIYKMTPQTISMQKMQIKFSDYSTGNPFDRKWIFREIPVRFDDEEVLHERFTHYTPSYESDSLRVTLIIMTNFGCSDTTSGSYPILKGEVWVPNAITPDADQNKELKVVCYNIDKYEIMIYTRAGLRVFHSTNIDESWDGTHNGKPCPSGTYVYRMIYTTKSKPDDSNEKSGTVLLVR
jgi:gliding motility-associated-like protein